MIRMILPLFCISCFAILDVSSSPDSRPLLEVAKSFTYAAKSSNGSQISQLLDELQANCVVIREGTDADQRPIFVNAQADFERAIVHGLKTQRITNVTCIIHTPAPATPLCTKGEISPGLVDSTILKDEERLLTVKKRPDILRDYLQVGGDLFTVYPKDGRTLRSAEQLGILDALLQQNIDHLHAIELNCAAIPRDLIGATYLITFDSGEKYVLSLRSYQANAPADDLWAIWFGPSDHPAVAERLHQVRSFLKEQGFSLTCNAGKG